MGESQITHSFTADDNLSDFLTKTTSGAKRHKLVSGVVHDIYDNFPKQKNLFWQDQLTDLNHRTNLEGNEIVDSTFRIIPTVGNLWGLYR